MSGALRYQNPELQELLASHYVTGSLRGLARRRMETLIREDSELRRRVRLWEGKLQPLHTYTPELQPKASTWRAIAASIGGVADPLLDGLRKKLRFYRWFSGFALACMLVLGVALLLPQSQPLQEVAGINYVAVMKDAQGEPTMVVTLAKEGRRLNLDMLKKPKIEDGQQLQLWAISKVDGSIASLGVIAVEKHIEMSLSKPEWGLIKDAEHLMVSAESDIANSPSELIVSKGLCVKVEGWQTKAG